MRQVIRQENRPLVSSNQDAKAENLISTITIDFSNNDELFEGFYRTYGSTSKERLWEFDGKVATLVW